MTSQSQFNIAAKSQEERDKVNVDLAASGVAYKERLNSRSLLNRSPESSLSTSGSISWNEYATTANREYNFRAHPIRATSKWQSRILKNRELQF